MKSTFVESCAHVNPQHNRRWWGGIGPALITACVVFGPGSLLVSANVGATHRFELLWLLALTGISGIIMITTATVIPGKTATNIGMLAESLKPLLDGIRNVLCGPVDCSVYGCSGVVPCRAEADLMPVGNCHPTRLNGSIRLSGTIHILPMTSLSGKISFGNDQGHMAGGMGGFFGLYADLCTIRG